MEFKDRFKQLRGFLNYNTQESFAVYLGFEKQYVQKYESGSSKPGLDFLVILFEKTKVNLNWLLTGQGEMFSIDDKSKSELVKEIAELKRERQKVNDAIVSQVADLKKIIDVTDKSKKII